MKSLSTLEGNIHTLLQQYGDLQQQVLQLQQENQRQRDEIMQTHAELVQLKADYNHLQTAHALVATDTLSDQERQLAKQRLTNLIAQIDRALEALKQ